MGFLVTTDLGSKEGFDQERTRRQETSVPTEASTSRASNRLLPVLGVLSIKEYPSSVREAKAIRVSASKRADL